MDAWESMTIKKIKHINNVQIVYYYMEYFYYLISLIQWSNWGPEDAAHQEDYEHEYIYVLVHDKVNGQLKPALFMDLE